jgi:hypothetical protein
MTQPYVLSFVGQNANGSVRWWTQQVLGCFAAYGLSSRLIDILDADWVSQLREQLAIGKPHFCFSVEGVGMNVQLNDGDNFWVRSGIPFLSYMVNSPYHWPSCSSVEGSGMYLLYGCKDFFDVYRNFMSGRAYASVLPHQYPDHALAVHTPWHERTHKIVFVKTGVNPEVLRQSWDSYPVKVRGILHDSAARVLSETNETIATVCAEAFADRQIHWGDRRELFLSTCSKVDFYARAIRAERMVRALMPHDALIVGDWSYLDHSNARSQFLGPIVADDLNALYAGSRILVNTSPMVRFGIHERIIAGLFAEAVVLSDTTPYLEQTLRNCPSFLGVEIDQATFADQVDHAVTSAMADPDSAEKTRLSAAVAREIFSLDDFVRQLLDYVALEKYREGLGVWMSPPIVRRASTVAPS